MNNEKPMSHTEGIDDLIEALRRGTLNPRQKEQIEDWTASDYVNRDVVDLFSGDSEMGPDMVRMRAYDQEGVWKAVVAADRKRSRNRLARRWTAVAAAACIVCGIVISLVGGSGDLQFDDIHRSKHRGTVLSLADGTSFEVGDLQMSLFAAGNAAEINISPDATEFKSTGAAEAVANLNTLTVPEGCDHKLVLDDGTVVWLNSGSKLIFPSGFAGDTRDVELTGEAYFEVAHDPQRPFTVAAGGQKVTVLGTSFNISAYEGDGYIETTLIEGAIVVAANGRSEQMRPGQQAKYDCESSSMTIVDVPNANAYASWTRDEFFFMDEPLGSICRKLSRSYGIEVRIMAPGLDTISYSGVIKRYESFGELARLMESTGEISFRMENNAVIVVPAGSKAR